MVKQLKVWLCSALLLLLQNYSLSGQQVTISNTITAIVAAGSGMNLGINNNYGPQQIAKNLFAAGGNINPVMSGGTLYVNATGTLSGGNTVATVVDAQTGSTQATGWWNGGTFYVVSHNASAANVGVFGTITSSTLNSGPGQQTFVLTVGSGSANWSTAPTQYDMIAIQQPRVPDSAFPPSAQVYIPSGTVTYSADIPSGNHQTRSVALTNGSQFLAGTDNNGPFINGNGNYQLTYQAKCTGASGSVGYSVSRTTLSGTDTITSCNATSGAGWQSFTHTVSNTETGSQGSGPMSCTLTATGAIIINDLQFVEVNSSNTTFVRAAVLKKLQSQQPSVIRVMAQDAWGSSFENLMVPTYARYGAIWGTVAGSPAAYGQHTGMPTGILDAFLLAQATNSLLWVTATSATMPSEMANITAYFSGTCGNGNFYTTERCNDQTRLGVSTASLTSQMSSIVIEPGNEEWNTGGGAALVGYIYGGNGLNQGGPVGTLDGQLEAAMKASPYYNSALKLVGDGAYVANGGSTGGGWNQSLLAAAAAVSQLDGFDVAPYQPANSAFLTDVSSETNTHGAFNQSAYYDNENSSGALKLAAGLASTYSTGLYIYEANNNIQCVLSSYSQATVNQYIGGVGNANAVLMLAMLAQRDNAAKEYANFEIAGTAGAYGISSTSGSCLDSTPTASYTPIWGFNVDMISGPGQPSVYDVDNTVGIGYQVIQSAIAGKNNLVTTSYSGPTLSQAAAQPVPSGNGGGYSIAAVTAMPVIEQVVYKDGLQSTPNGNYSMVLFNTDVNNSRTVTLAGTVPTGTTKTTIFAASNNLTDTCASSSYVSSCVVPVPTFTSGAAPSTVAVPAGRFAVLQWTVGGSAPPTAATCTAGTVTIKGGNLVWKCSTN